MGKKILAFCLSFLIVLPFLAGCGRKSNDFYYDLDIPPVNLDPQSASDYSSMLLISSLFEGLLRSGEHGEILPAAAESYEILDDGTTYVFTLRENGTWSNGDAVTADDFVFAFQRLFTPDTNAPYASFFSGIENAEQIMSGRLPPEELGVEAKDSNTLEIRLLEYNARFLKLLTTAPAMPCNEKFFMDTRGKYGLTKKSILGNGPFYLSGWEEKSVLLRRNAKYSDENMTARSVQFNVLSSMDTEDSIQQRFLEGKTSAAALDNLDGVSVDAGRVSCENTVWGIVFNCAQEPFSNENIRKALIHDMDYSTYSPDPDGRRPHASAIIPHDLRIEGDNFREKAGEKLVPDFSSAQAQAYYSEGLSELGMAQLQGLTLIMPEGQGHENVFAGFSQVWQRDLSLYMKVELLPADEYRKRLKSGNFDCALISLSGASDGMNTILDPFRSDNADNYWGYKDAAYDSFLIRAESGRESPISLYIQAEKRLIEKAVFIPFYYQSEYFVMNRDVAGIVYDFGNRMVSFQYGIQK